MFAIVSRETLFGTGEAPSTRANVHKSSIFGAKTELLT